MKKQFSVTKKNDHVGSIWANSYSLPQAKPYDFIILRDSHGNGVAVIDHVINFHSLDRKNHFEIEVS